MIYSSEIQALIDDLGLVPGPPPPPSYTPVLFCDQYHCFLQEKKRSQQRLLNRYYERNKKYSKAWRDHYCQIVFEPYLF